MAGVLIVNSPLCHAMQAPTATGGSRKALVIGNGNYVSLSKIPAAAQDVQQVSGALKSVGFAVTEAKDVGVSQLSSTIESFINTIAKGDIAFFYYSGLAVQSNQENYILPVDFSVAKSDLLTAAYSVSRIDAGLYQRGSAARVLILDACREIPALAARYDQGLAVPQLDNPGVLIALSAQPGRTEAANPSSGPGLFAKEIAKFLTTPGLSLEDVFSKAQASVIAATSQAQIPMYYPLAVGSTRLKEDRGVAATEKQPAATPESVAGPHVRGRYDSVVIGTFSSDPGVKIPPKVIERLVPALTEQLASWKLREVITDAKKPSGAALRIEGTFTAYSAGSRAARLAIGYGVGTAKVTGQVRLVDAATGKLLFQDITFGGVAGGLTGGHAEDVMNYFAQAILKILIRSGLL